LGSDKYLTGYLAVFGNDHDLSLFATSGENRYDSQHCQVNPEGIFHSPFSIVENTAQQDGHAAGGEGMATLSKGLDL
jgi:hypothetical protein